ncbi:MAG: phosphate acyltransferase PlsX [Deltaproteobacteria bacterium]|jgi:phosphate acyltransferase|nr:phosphate acyltransferase PlsX [Deltaproteobacteria bacterium]MBT4090395.1 phosphate acyltransferase PlsX [Deltaproteobacteria bacterium]MBT4263578.1 phosphate acyltransferase PlsX [Deltaproteobacteria bacterium]MBT4644343.1 phosphate acyltransferase PlsX [Deltaproteobacteria bacterium]MBT6500424.1 phosphate acyltransferase PlsX [Deltaproteobacteria bacterium]
MTIAIDAMGGDAFPENPVLGAVKAANELNIHVLLVGDESAVKAELDKHRCNRSKIEIAHASQVIGMDEPVASALRTKKDASMRVCYDLHKNGTVDGVVSSGNSGAMLAVGRFVLKMIPGISRPCISAILPALGGKVLLVDAGANIDCTPEQLCQFAILGNIYLSDLHAVPSPRIGLLNVGSEEGKGDDRRKKTFDMLKESSLNFIGNVEGEDFFSGDVDIVVTDGFAGNILLKSVQAAASFTIKLITEEMQCSLLARIGALWLRPSFKKLQKKISYAEFGGAPLIGLRGNGIVCHGKSNPDAISYGVGFAQKAADEKWAERMSEGMLAYQANLK